MAVYLISDLHGNLDAFNKVIEYINRDPESQDQLIFAGDSMDRGQHSCELVARYVKLILHPPPNKKYFFIVGNHEIDLLNFLMYGREDLWNLWLFNGGTTVCKELLKFPRGVDRERRVYKFLRDFALLISKAYFKCRVKGRFLYVVTHAGHRVNVEEGRVKDFFCRADAIEDRGYSERIGREEDFLRHKLRCTNLEKPKHLCDTKCKYRKFYVFGHTITDTRIIETRWSDPTYNYLFLPIDAGLANLYCGTSGHVAIARIEPTKHSIDFLEVSGDTPPMYSEVAYCSLIEKEKIRALFEQIWPMLWKEIPFLWRQISNVLYRDLTISWVEGWASISSLHHVHPPESQRPDYYHTSSRVSFLVNPEIADYTSNRKPEKLYSDLATVSGGGAGAGGGAGGGPFFPAETVKGGRGRGGGGPDPEVQRRPMPYRGRLSPLSEKQVSVDKMFRS